jgi:sugar phosphate isomerase/epimerase
VERSPATDKLAPGDLVLCSGTLPPATPWSDRLAAANAAGFCGISVWGRDHAAARRDGLSDTDLRVQVDDHGLAVAEIDPAWWWLPGAAEIGKSLVEVDNLDVFRFGEPELFAVADALGARSLNAVDVFGGDWTLDDAAAALAGLCDRAAEHGLLVHVEFLPWSRIPDLATAWEIVQRADRPNAGVAVDAWHWARTAPACDLETLRTIPGPKLLAVQLDDAPAAVEPDLMHATLHDRLLPGDGAIDLEALVATLHQIGAVAPFGVEVFSDALQALAPTEAAQRAADATRRVVAASRRR